MFLLDDGTVVYSASDLADAASCEFAVLRSLDGKLGRIEPVELAGDAMLERAARLGDRHEARVLDEYAERFGPWDPAAGRGVAQIERPERGQHTDRTVLEAKHAETLHVLRTGADVVFQAGFFDGRFGGWADFLVRVPAGADGSAARLPGDGDAVPHASGAGDAAARPASTGGVYAVHDTKLARHVRATALLQVAAYADQLMVAGIPVSDHVHLVLGDRTTTSHRLADLLPVYHDRRARLQTMLDTRADADAPLGWGEGPYRACGRCPVCRPEIEARRDVLLVAGMRTTQRARLNAAGITTVEELAVSQGRVPGIGAAALDRMRAQARLQSDPALLAVASGDTDPRDDGGGSHDGEPDHGPSWANGVPYELFAPQMVGMLPPPAPGDVFFDFEGDPLWTPQDGSTDWGLEYLFGVVEQPELPDGEPVFRPFWAHDRAEERQALVDFLAYVTERRARHPQMHVYHYAAYERTALLRLAGRHGVGEDVVDDLLRDGVLVDLYATVRASLRTGQDSYSLKKLEPLYMDDARSGEVTTAGDSIVEYAEACHVRDDGDLAEWSRRLESIASYNEYDCVSTLRLRDWLLDRAAEHGVLPRGGTGATGSGGTDSVPGTTDTGGRGGSDDEADTAAPERDELAESLLAYADAAGPGPRSPDRQAVAMLAASLGYHWREEKPFWWAHFDRLTADPEEWMDTRSVLVAEPGTVEIVQPWHIPSGRRTLSRVLRMVGQLEPGSELRAGAGVYALYDPPTPDCAIAPDEGRRGWTEKVTIREVGAEQIDGQTYDVLVLEDGLRMVDPRHEALPMAVVPGRPPPTRGITAAIRAVATDVSASLPSDTSPSLPGDTSRSLPGGTLPHQPAVDLLRRRPPRTISGRAIPPPDGPGGPTEAITAALLDLDGSYLAVQGPPGTGKTYTGAHVIARLVEHGWAVGVVAQSHAVVENMLRAVADAGVPPEQIGKRPGEGTPKAGGTAKAGGDSEAGGDLGTDRPWTVLDGKGFARFYAAQTSGYVVGGTAWDFTNPTRLPPGPLDLMVVDEAGQFALANTVAVSGAARNLLLLGDPQQLPQVSQGRHPEPVDGSALGWLTDGHDTLPASLGYFLDRTWRMHPALCAAVSHLSYEDRLTTVPHTAERSLDGVEPGVHVVLVEHEGNAVSSAQEAAEVVAQIRDLVGRRWRDPHDGVDRPLEPSDVIVVAAYNAQVAAVRAALADAGPHGTDARSARPRTAGTHGADLRDVEVGTVDKFQGRQAAVVIVTTAASSADDVPRGMEFLLNRNRVNVAISRGKWCAVIVRSAHLTDYLPDHPEQLAELGAFLGLAPAEPGTAAVSP